MNSMIDFVNFYLSIVIINMNSMIDFVNSYHLFMNNDKEDEKEEVLQVEENNAMDLYNKDKPKFRKKPLKQIFNIKKK